MKPAPVVVSTRRSIQSKVKLLAIESHTSNRSSEGSSGEKDRGYLVTTDHPSRNQRGHERALVGLTGNVAKAHAQHIRTVLVGTGYIAGMNPKLGRKARSLRWRRLLQSAAASARHVPFHAKAMRRLHHATLHQWQSAWRGTTQELRALLGHIDFTAELRGPATARLFPRHPRFCDLREELPLSNATNLG